MPKVSIIIPVYNAEKYLSSTLDSVLGQTFLDLEIVCVNDGSTDASAQILNQYQERDERVRVVTQKNGGGSAARNAGIQQAKGEYLMFIDADDLYAEDIVEEAYNRAVETGVDIVFYNFARFVGKPTVMAVTSRTTPGRDARLFTKESYAERFFNDFAIITWNKLVKKSVIVDNKLAFDTKLSHNHDVDFSIRLMLATKSFSWLDKVGYYYRHNESGLTATKRSDPTNVLKILINLNKIVSSKYEPLKQSFDNYVVSMVAGTLSKYGGDANKQKEVFDFARDTLIPEIGLRGVPAGYLGETEWLAVLKIVERGDFKEMVSYINAPKRKLRAYVRRLYDTAQRALAHLAV